MIHGEKWSPYRIGFGIGIIVGIGPRDRCPWPPKSVEIFGMEACDDRVRRSRVGHGEQSGSFTNIQAGADCQIDQVTVPVYIRVLGPEVGDVGLLGRAEGAVCASIIPSFDEVPGVGVRCYPVWTIGSKPIRVSEGERHDLPDLGVNRLSAAATIRFEFARRGRVRAALV